MNPRDPESRFNIAVNFETGEPLTTGQAMHLQRLKEAADSLYQAMHDAEGSAHAGHREENVFLSRRMSIAATHLETALMYARKAALEVK